MKAASFIYSRISAYANTLARPLRGEGLLTVAGWLRPTDLLPPLLAGLAAALTGLGLMGAAAWLIIKASFAPPLYTLTLGITFVRACGLSRAVFRYLERYLGHRLAFNAYGQWQLNLYHQAEALLPLKEGLTAQGAWLQKLVTGCADLRDSYVRTWLPLAVNTLLTLLACLALGQISYPAGLVLLSIFVLHLAAWLLLPKADLTPAETIYRNELLELCTGRQELNLSGNHAPILNRLQKTASAVENSLSQKENRLDMLSVASAVLRDAGLVFVLLLLLQITGQGVISHLELGVWLLILLTLNNEYTAILPALQQARLAKAALAELNTQTACPYFCPPHEGRVNPCGDGVANLLTVKNLCFSYPGQAPLFRNLSFSITTGQHTAIIGESGCGKTTLAYLLAGLYHPISGDILYKGSPHPDTVNPAGNLQGCYVFSDSIRANFLRLYPSIEENEIKASLHYAQLQYVLAEIGLDTPLGPDACQLSGGERNRLLTALALPSKAPLLLLDEPTASLDKEKASALLAALEKRTSQTGQTLLIITHEIILPSFFRQVIKLSP